MHSTEDFVINNNETSERFNVVRGDGCWIAWMRKKTEMKEGKSSQTHGLIQTRANEPKVWKRPQMLS